MRCATWSFGRPLQLPNLIIVAIPSTCHVPYSKSILLQAPGGLPVFSEVPLDERGCYIASDTVKFLYLDEIIIESSKLQKVF